MRLGMKWQQHHNHGAVRETQLEEVYPAERSRDKRKYLFFQK